MRSLRRALTAAALGVVIASCGGGDGAVDPGDRLPEVDITALDGGATISLSEIDGPAVINLWATWCAPCRREIPDFEAVHVARGSEIQIIGVNIGEDADDAAAFLTDVGATYDQYLDSTGLVVTALETSTMPVTLVIDRNARLSTRHLGPMDENDLNAAIDEALSTPDDG